MLANAQPKPPVAVGKPASSGSALMALLKMEADAREVATLVELNFFIANEPRKLTRARQCFVFEVSRQGTQSIIAISGFPAVERAAPMVMAMEDMIAMIAATADIAREKEFNISAYKGTYAEFASGYPFCHLLWLPFLDRKAQPIGGVLFAREHPWLEADIVIGKRLSQTFAHATRELKAERRFSLSAAINWKYVSAAVALSALFLMVPVSVTTLAPFEITPRDAEIVAAPIDGTIEDIPIDPNTTVTEGQTVVTFASAALKSRLDVAERDRIVADARLKRATQQAFTDDRGRHELGVLMSELRLKTAERDYAREIYARAEVHASRSGLALFSDKNEMLGRPVSVGERIMRIADPSHVEVSLDVPVADAILLNEGARVKLFLDTDPLHPREAVIKSADYQARVHTGNQLTYRAIAALHDDSELPRLGSRGVAEIYGSKAALAYYVFRRPLSVLRQWIGL